MKGIVIVGTNPLAEIAFEYFNSKYEFVNIVAGFSVEKKCVDKEVFMKRMVVPFEDIEMNFPPSRYSVFISVGYDNMNDDRTRLYLQAKEKGYDFASYISPHAFVWDKSKIGENCFIFENNVIQPFVEIGNNCILWSGNHVGHHTKIGDNCFISSHVVISGECNIGRNCFFGVNSTVANTLNIGDYCLIGSATNVVKDCKPNKVYVGNPARAIRSSR